MKLHASYTLLKAWNDGTGYEQVVKMYFKLEKFTTRAMATGQEVHKAIAENIKEFGRLPSDMGGHKFTSPIVEKLYEVEINEWLSLKMFADCIDGEILYDWKTGAKTSESYAGEKQLPLYGAILGLAGVQVNRGEIHRVDLSPAHKLDTSVVWLTKEAKQAALDWALEQATQIHNYFTENGLYEKYQASRDQSPTRA